MRNAELIMNLVYKKNGTITTFEITEAGIPRGSLKYLVDKGLLERASRGVYNLPEVLDDEFLNLQTRFKKGIFSRETALFLNDLIDRTPVKYNMTFPISYNTMNLSSENVKYSRVKNEIYKLGIVEVLTPSKNIVKAYNIERTICDILVARNNTDIQIIVDALKRYVKSDSRNIPLLSEYAKILKVEKKLTPYLEVLL